MRSRLAGSCGRRQHPIKINVPSLVILARYGLDGRKDTQTVHSNALNEDTQDELGDPRLEKLWHKVPLAIFPLLKLVLTCGELQCGTGSALSLLSTLLPLLHQLRLLAET